MFFFVEHFCSVQLALCSRDHFSPKIPTMNANFILIFAIFSIFSSGSSLNTISNQNVSEAGQNLRIELRQIFGKNTEEYKISDLLKLFSSCNSNWLTDEEIEKLRSSVLNPLKNLKIALIIVDYQNDFINGSLAVETGDAHQDPLDALPYINNLLGNTETDQAAYTQDWHPYNHISFVGHAKDSDRVLTEQFRNKTLAPFDTVQFLQPNISQTLYPSHCVPNTPGSLLYPEMTIAKNAIYVHKGTEVLVDSYSAFKNNNGKLLELDSQLKSKGINAFVACGLAYDICVFYTLKDGAELGYLAAVSPDCSKGFSAAGINKANEEFQQKNIAVVSGEDASSILSRAFVPIEWAFALANRTSY